MNLLKYFVTSTPGPQMSYYIPLTILAIGLIIGSIVFGKIYKKKKKTDLSFKKLFRSTSKILFGLGIALGFLLLVRYENIPYFSMRLWLYATCLLILFVAYKYIKIFKVDYPKAKASQPKKAKKDKKQRYTTSKKRRK